MRGRSYSYSPSPPRHYHRRGRSPSPRGRYGGGGSRDMPTSLLVRNLRHGCKPEDLRKPFGQFGPLKDIYLPRDYYTGEPRGFGFVQYVDPADAAEAKYLMDRQILFGRELTVVFAEENRKKPSDMRARERTSRHDRRSPRPSRSARYSRSRSPRYSPSPPPRRGRSPRGHGHHSPLPRRHSYSQSPPKKHIYSPSPRQRDYSRSVSPDDKRGRRERSYSHSPVDRRPRSRSPYEEEEEERERSRSASR